MKKLLKIFIIIIISVVIIWLIFVISDYIRLKNSKRGTQPFITVDIEEYDNQGRKGIIYKGLGYSINYYNINHTFGYGTEFRIFNIFSLRSWEAN